MNLVTLVSPVLPAIGHWRQEHLAPSLLAWRNTLLGLFLLILSICPSCPVLPVIQCPSLHSLLRDVTMFSQSQPLETNTWRGANQ